MIKSENGNGKFFAFELFLLNIDFLISKAPTFSTGVGAFSSAISFDKQDICTLNKKSIIIYSGKEFWFWFNFDIDLGYIVFIKNNNLNHKISRPPVLKAGSSGIIFILFRKIKIIFKHSKGNLIY